MVILTTKYCEKLIKRREIPAGNPVSDNALLDRLYRFSSYQNSQELDRTFAINAENAQRQFDNFSLSR